MGRQAKLGTPVAELDTPALLIDLDVLEHNIAQMAAFIADRPVALRPHSKTHKCPEIAQRQIAAGAIGITCAKVSEAEVMAAAGIEDILIANQITGAVKIDRLTDLAQRCQVMVAVDNAENVLQLSAACAAKQVQVRVLVEVDIGMGRCGVAPMEPALDLARQVDAAAGLTFAGLQAYEGHLVMVEDREQRAAQVQAAFAPLAATIELFERSGLPVAIVSGGGTGTYDMTGNLPFITELQCGSYVFMDNTYGKIRPEFGRSLTVLTGVVSRPTPERVVVDAGLKSMTSEFGWPAPLEAPGVQVRYLSEEHGVLDLAEPEVIDWQGGDRVRFWPSHCCTTVNLANTFYVIRDGRLVDMWPIAARGCNQ